MDVAADEAAFRTFLDEARAALAQGDPSEAERRAKAISAIARAERDVAELLAAARRQPPEENDEYYRAELRRRLARFVEAERAGAPAEVLERIAAEDPVP